MQKLGGHYKSVLPKRIAHLNIREYLENKYLSKTLYNEYYKFSVVRNPYSRVRSFFGYLSFYRSMDINRFVSEILPRKCDSGDKDFWFFMPQSEFILDSNGGFGVDDILFLENINEDWAKVVEKGNVHTLALPRRNVTKSVKGGEFNEQSIRVINEIYYEDFKSLGYMMS